MSDAPRSARRKGVKGWLVEPYKQVKIGLVFLFLNFAFASLITVVFGYYLHDIHTSIQSHFSQMTSQISPAAENAGAVAPPELKLDAGEKLKVPLIVGSVLMIMFIFLTLLVSIRYTHGIYGPLVSIHRYLDELADGKAPKPLKLRDQDQLQDLANKLNRAVESLQ